MHLREDANVVTKYPYSIHVVCVIRCGEACLEVESNAVSVKLTQGKVKAAVNGAGVFSVVAETAENGLHALVISMNFARRDGGRGVGLLLP